MCIKLRYIEYRPTLLRNELDCVITDVMIFMGFIKHRSKICVSIEVIIRYYYF